MFFLLFRESIDDDCVSSDSSGASYVASHALITEMYDCSMPDQASHTLSAFCHHPSDDSCRHQTSRLPPSFMKARSGRFVKMTTRTPPSKSREDLVGSFSRALAAQPREALVEMKARTAALQRKACVNRKPYILAKDRFLVDSLHSSAQIFPSSELVSPHPLQSSDTDQAAGRLRLPMHRNPSMALRFYHKAPSERRRTFVDSPSCPQQTWLLSLPKSQAGIVRWDHHGHRRKPTFPSLASQPKLSVHVPCEYVIDRPFSEERSTGVRPESKLDRTYSATPISHRSSDNLVGLGDVAGGTGRVMFNQGRETAQQVRCDFVGISLFSMKVWRIFDA